VGKHVLAVDKEEFVRVMYKLRCSMELGRLPTEPLPVSAHLRRLAVS
jgi:hypothetical protein